MFEKFSKLDDSAREKLIIEDPSFKTSKEVTEMIYDEILEIPELQD
jgi:hypothetical protein